MRAFRRGLGLLALLIVLIGLGGCSSPTKQRYLRHLSVTLAPNQPAIDTLASDRPAVVAASNRPTP